MHGQHGRAILNTDTEVEGIKKVIMLAIVGVILAMVVVPAYAQKYPDVSKLKPFLAEAHSG